MLIFLSIVILSCSKDSDIFSEVIQEEIEKSEIAEITDAESFQPFNDEYNITAISETYLFDVLGNDFLRPNF